MVKKILIATGNIGKFQEISNFLSDLPLEIISLFDLKIEEDVKEDKKTYKDNSQKKALFYAEKSKLPTLADDGGLEIEALGGAPGVRSKRWLGHEATDKELIENMIKVAKTLPDNNRRAFFKVVISFALPGGKVWSSYGQIEGIIAKKPFLKLKKGYPYRSFFYLPGLGKYYHENQLSDKEMEIYNHRYKALQKIKKIIRKELKI